MATDSVAQAAPPFETSVGAGRVQQTNVDARIHMSRRTSTLFPLNPVRHRWRRNDRGGSAGEERHGDGHRGSRWHRATPHRLRHSWISRQRWGHRRLIAQCIAASNLVLDAVPHPAAAVSGSVTRTRHGGRETSPPAAPSKDRPRGLADRSRTMPTTDSIARKIQGAATTELCSDELRWDPWGCDAPRHGSQLTVYGAGAC